MKTLDTGRSVETVVILGAGASRGASFADYVSLPPFLDSDFFELTHLLTTGQDDARRLREQLYSDFGSATDVGMEEFFTYVECCREVDRELNVSRGPKRRQYADAADRFVRIVTLMLQQSCRYNPCAYHQQLAARLEPGDTVISFNYDTIIDDALVKMGGNRWRGNDRYGVPVTGRGDAWVGETTTGRPCNSTVRLLKLHGSTHWRSWDEKAKAVLLAKDGYGIKQPLLVPPAWNKRITNHQPLGEIWKKARRSLQAARALIIIGYSLPRTDLLFRALLSLDTCQSMERRQKLRQLCIVNPSASDGMRLRGVLASVVDGSTNVRPFKSFKDYHFTTVRPTAAKTR